MNKEMKILKTRRETFRQHAIDAFKQWKKDPKNSALLENYRAAYQDYRDADEESFLEEAARD